MKKRCALFLFLFFVVYIATPCTTFFINHNGELIFGRNYDWVTGAGMLYTNQKGLHKTSMPTSDGETASWVSQYGSISFNQYGKEFPTGGMNEQGLVVELMWLDGTKYPQPDNRPSLGVLQWIQYQLDNCSTVDQVIATDKKIRITSTGTPLHYLVADGKGNVATIEFLEGKMVVHRDSQLLFPVLTNSTYEESKRIITPDTYSGYASFQDNSIQRFVKACGMIKQFSENKINTPVVDYAFSILENVSQGEHTKWSIVYDLKNKVIRFKTRNFSNIKTLSFSSFNFSCDVSPKAYDMNQPGKENISYDFKNYSAELNRSLIEKAVYESRREVPISEKSKEESISYAKKIQCK